MRRSAAAFASTLLTFAASAHAAADPAAASAKIFTELTTGKPQPGCAASVMRDGRVLWAGGFGYADLATKRKITPDTLFNIASISKQFTAFAILQLEAAGKLSLDDSIRKFLPELPEYAQPVTIRHLLHHTGGLRDYDLLANIKGIDYADKLSEDDTIKLMARQRGTDFAPGSEHVYSNTGYVLLAVVVERASKQTMRDYAAEHIFGPLGMRETSYVDHYPVDLPALARGYRDDGKGGYAIDESAWEPTGDGQVHTTVRELALWEQNFATGRVGGRALVEKMSETGVLNNGDKLNYAMGVNVGHYRGLRSIEHSGGWAGYHGYLMGFPDQGIGVAVLCNAPKAESHEYTTKLADLWLGDKLGPVNPTADTPPNENVKRHAGVAASAVQPGIYANDVGGVLEVRRGKSGLEIRASEGKGVIGAGQGNIYPLSGGEEMAYVAFPANDRVVLDIDPHVYSLLKPWQPKSLQPYVGSYFSDDADIGFTVTGGKEGLMAKLGTETARLRPVAENKFRAGRAGLIEFRADGSAVLLTPDLRGVVFSKTH